MMCNKRAFTLAEVLITLGIIGIIAALTMPALVANYKEKATVVKVKKAYSILSQAYTMAVLDHGEPKGWDLVAYNSKEGAENLRDILGSYMVDIKKGYTDNDFSYIVTLDGAQQGITGSKSVFLVLSDGTKISFYSESANCANNIWGTGPYANVCAQIDVFTDNKQPAAGINFFPFYLTAQGIIPMGGPENTRNFETLCRKNKTVGANGWGCTAWVVLNENMEYLHCNDLSWNGKTKCD